MGWKVAVQVLVAERVAELLVAELLVVDFVVDVTSVVDVVDAVDLTVEVVEVVEVVAVAGRHCEYPTSISLGLVVPHAWQTKSSAASRFGVGMVGTHSRWSTRTCIQKRK
jgi:hypothetical protein